MASGKERKTGSVALWKGTFGFIKPDDEDVRDIFFHQTHIKMEGYRSTKTGDRVSYEIGENHKGSMAVNVIIESVD